MSVSTRSATDPSWWLPLAFAGAVIAVMLSAAIPLTQSDGDLFAHIALGREILVSGVPARVTPAWGSAMLFALAHEFGGLPFIVAITALVSGIAHGLAALLLQHAGLSPRHAFLSAMVGLTLASSHWLARPHAFTLLGLSVVMTSLHTTRGTARAALVPVFALWANLHGGWVFGWLVLLCYAVGSSISVRTRWMTPSLAVMRECRWLWIVTLSTLMATMATPYGVDLHRAIWQTLTDPAVAAAINEYRPPSFATPVDALFLILVMIAMIVVLYQRRPMFWASAFIIVLSVGAALRAGRNISLFALTGWPLLISHFLAPTTASVTPPSHRHGNRARMLALAMIAGVVVLCVGRYGEAPSSPLRFVVPIDPERFPVRAVEQMQRADVAGPLLTTWSWSGYVPYAWRGHRAWFDPLAFSSADLRSLKAMLLGEQGWQAELDHLGVEVVLVPPTSPLAVALGRAGGWWCWYRDDTAVILRREETAGGRHPRPRALRSSDQRGGIHRVRG
jgi:hypothetical protein